MCTDFSVNTCTIYAKNHGLLVIVLVVETLAVYKRYRLDYEKPIEVVLRCNLHIYD